MPSPNRTGLGSCVPPLPIRGHGCWWPYRAALGAERRVGSLRSSIGWWAARTGACRARSPQFAMLLAPTWHSGVPCLGQSVSSGTGSGAWAKHRLGARRLNSRFAPVNTGRTEASCSPRMRSFITVFRLKRARLPYFARRCFAEGRSKAQVTALVGAQDGLASERTYTRITLPRGARAGLADCLMCGDVTGLARTAAITGGLLITTGGYLRGRMSGFDPRVERAPSLVSD